jgi:hypothetical protein
LNVTIAVNTMTVVVTVPSGTYPSKNCFTN